MTTLQRRLLFVAALLLCCAPQTLTAVEDKCSALSQYHDPKFSYDFVSHILRVLADYGPCEPGDPQCLCHVLTIRKNLEPYKGNGITLDTMKQSKRFATLYKFYHQENFSYPRRCESVDELLLDMAVDLPDLEFVFTVQEWPQAHFLSGLSGPVFSYSKSERHLNIMCPAWSFWTVCSPILQDYPHGLDPWDWMRQHMAARAARIPWRAKSSKGFIPGSRSSPEHDNLVMLPRRSQDLVNAQYTLHVADKSEPPTLGADPVEEMPLVEHCQYKYALNFYNQLLPWVHFVPVASEARVEELADLILYLREHDNMAEEIAERGHKIVWLHLRLEDVQWYWRKWLQEYAQR